MGSLGKGEEGWRTTLGGRVVAQKGAGQGFAEWLKGRAGKFGGDDRVY